MGSDQQKEIRPFTFEHSFDVLMTPEEEGRQKAGKRKPPDAEEELAAAREGHFKADFKPVDRE